MEQKDIVGFERFLLSCILHDSKIYSNVLNSGYAFTDMQNRRIWSLIGRASSNGSPFDLTALMALAREYQVKMTELADLLTIAYAGANWKYYLEGLIAEQNRTRLLEKLGEVMRSGDILQVKDILADIRKSEQAGMFDEYEELKALYCRVKEGEVVGMRTGIPCLDTGTLGILPKHIWVVGGYYGTGKTYFAINAINSILKQGKRVLFFSMEMSTAEVMQRLVSNLDGVSLHSAITKPSKSLSWIKDLMTKGQLIVMQGAQSLASIKSTFLSTDSDIVVLDYVQLIGGKGGLYERVSDACLELQRLTQMSGSSLMLLSQINNQASQSETEDGFKGAGEIGQIANVAIRIVRNQDIEDEYRLKVVKCRHGAKAEHILSLQFPGGRIIDKTDLSDSEQKVNSKKRTNVDLEDLPF